MRGDAWSAFSAVSIRKGQSPLTRQNYARDLTAFVRFYLAYHGQPLPQAPAQDAQGKMDQVWLLQTFGDWAQVTATDVQAFVAERMTRGISARTVARQLSALRAFYRFLLDQTIVTHNPAADVKAPKQPKPLPKSLDVDRTGQLLDQPLETWQDVRNQAIFELLYSSGLRLAECAALDLQGVLDRLEEGLLEVNAGKGNKDRLVPVGEKAIQAIRQWLAIRADYAKPDETALFVNRFGGRLHARSIQQQLNQRAQKSGLPMSVSPHRLRHACATHVLESSGDLRAVQDLLGHANLSTTQIYTQLDMQHLTKVYDRAHPRSKKPN
ncbi:tyrosine recombinase XerC [Hydrogenovibrio halophilus]|uniref:tyrosine recombinase XerC n=1 Tax=Hydrogenovibrio halophilus TaxID=373391 RepID=UPI0003694536|nr:tyrosine recombinase XerC [Hydrogenovibrio halophilus]